MSSLLIAIIPSGVIMSPALVTVKILSASNDGEFVTLNVYEGIISNLHDYWATFFPAAVDRVEQCTLCVRYG